MRNPRHTFTRSQVLYGYLVETFEPTPKLYEHNLLQIYCTSMIGIGQ